MIKIKKISIRQLICISTVLLISMRVIIEPSYMFLSAGRDGFISCLFAFAVQIIGLVFIMLVVRKNQGKSFGLIFEECFGVAVTKIIMILLFVFFSLKIISVDFEMQNFLLEVFYEELYSKVFLIPFFLVVIYVALKGPRIFARLSELFLPFGVFVLIYTLIIAMGNVQMLNSLPILANGIKPVLSGTKYGLSQMGEFLAILFLTENIEIKNSEKPVRSILITSSICAVFMTGFYFLFVSVFGDVAISLKEGIIRMTQFSTSLNVNFRIDGISAVMWLPLNVILLCINFYCAGKTLVYIFNIKLNLSIFIEFVLFIILKFIPLVTSEAILAFETNYFVYASLLLQIVLPFALFLVSKLKRRVLYEKNIKISA